MYLSIQARRARCNGCVAFPQLSPRGARVQRRCEAVAPASEHVAVARLRQSETGYLSCQF